MSTWAAMVAVGLVSYVFRAVPLVVLDRVRIGERTDRVVRHAGAAAVTALLVGSVGHGFSDLRPTVLAATAVALALAARGPPCCASSWPGPPCTRRCWPWQGWQRDGRPPPRVPAVRKVSIRLLGGFEVAVDGTAVPAARWGRRHATALVKLLALRPDRRLHREQVLDLVWPEDQIDSAAPKLHKAAHYARRAAGDPGAIVLRGEIVQLFPDADVAVDVHSFELGAADAVSRGDAALAAELVERHGGELLPDDVYEDWAAARREQLRRLRIDLLRLLERWDDIVALDPGDELAHVELMKARAAAGDRYGALRQYDRLDRTLRSELGVQPGREATRLRDRLLRSAEADPAADEVLVGRDAEQAALDRAMADAARRGARTVVISGPPGIGKSALLQRAVEQAAGLGWRTGVGTAASMAGGWAYAPVLDALADLCRRHPALLDGLGDRYREEIDRVLAGAEATWSGQSTHQRLFVAVAELVRLASATTGVLLAVDDLHDADDGTVRLLHYLTRALADASVLFVFAQRSTGAAMDGRGEARAGLVGRTGVDELEVGPLDADASRQLLGRHAPSAAAEQVERMLDLAGGNPYVLTELARHAAPGPMWASNLDAIAVAGIPPLTREVLQRVATTGAAFDIDEFVALSGLPDEEAFAHLDQAVALGIVEPGGSGHRFRHRLVRDALLDFLAPHRLRRVHLDAARRLEELGASPARIGHHLVEAGEPRRAVPHLLAAAETEAAMGAYRDALALVDAVWPNATGLERSRLVALRADLLMALGSPAALGAYRDALGGRPAR